MPNLCRPNARKVSSREKKEFAVPTPTTGTPGTSARPAPQWHEPVTMPPTKSEALAPATPRNDAVHAPYMRGGAL
jgi:hypothetical protein